MRGFVESLMRDMYSKFGGETQKKAKFGVENQNKTGVTQKLRPCRGVEMVEWVTRHTWCQFERDYTVY
jgi:hypothetical protein